MKRTALLAAAVTDAAPTAPLLGHVTPLRALWPRTSGVVRPGWTALTFDDGPDAASTPRFLDLLAGRGVQATFFLLGEMLLRSPDVARRAADEGHELAVHSWDHRSHLVRGPGRSTREQLLRTADLIESVTGDRPTLFRPPYGHLSAADLRAARRAGLQPVLWTSWRRDWTATATPASVLQNALHGRLEGGTVLLHDSDCTSAPGAWRSALGALPSLLDVCATRGLQVSAVSASTGP